jgi:hypothetical protein
MNDAFTRELRSDSRALRRPVSYTSSTIRDIFHNMLDDRTNISQYSPDQVVRIHATRELASDDAPN